MPEKSAALLARCEDWPGIIRAYADLLPVTDATPVVTLREGDTPLIPSEHIGPSLPGNIRLFYKFEGANPTGSFKDRGMTMAVSKARERGVGITMCASTGNTSAAAAAYSARAGMECIVLIPQGKIAFGKLSQALIHGARTVQVDGNFDDCLRIVREITDSYPIELVNSLNPMRMEGQKTAAFEVCDQLGEPPDVHILPVGNAGNITAYWIGYQEYGQGLPRLLGGQAAGAAPLVRGEVVKKPESIATAIRIGNPARWHEAMRALDESGGMVAAVGDEEILQSWKWLASLEGLFVEPASATGVAVLHQQIRQGEIDPGGKTVVCVLTGHGLKDPDMALQQAAAPRRLPATMAALEDYLLRRPS